MGIEENFDIIKIFLLTTIAFVITIFWTPLLTHFLYKYKLGKKIRSEGETPIYSKMHQAKSGTPTMGGILIWFTVLFMALLFFVLSQVVDIEY